MCQDCVDGLCEKHTGSGDKNSATGHANSLGLLGVDGECVDDEEWGGMGPGFEVGGGRNWGRERESQKGYWGSNWMYRKHDVSIYLLCQIESPPRLDSAPTLAQPDKVTMLDCRARYAILYQKVTLRVASPSQLVATAHTYHAALLSFARTTASPHAHGLLSHACTAVADRP
ncbi:hypothetical protein JB92DRAFT_2826958 [Gautieria morchelliformis]|nr:hypothetical protein JB92DRAFT_2826958 [Gautieria morchelliformis]